MVPPIQRSDYANYLFIARNIVQNHIVVEDDGKRALIPPGEPAFLAAGLEIFGDHAWTPLVVNLFCYVALSLVVMWLAGRIAGERAAFWSMMALAVWPSMVVFATLAASEHPFLPFYVTACSLPWVRDWKWVWSAECQRDSLPFWLADEAPMADATGIGSLSTGKAGSSG